MRQRFMVRHLSFGLRAWLAILVAGIGLSGGCNFPGGSTEGTGPSISLPLPVIANISVSTPDDGVAHITGGPGAVTPGSLIEITNFGAGTAPIGKSVFGTATPVTVTADSTGAFRTTIAAGIGDLLHIVQLDKQKNHSEVLSLAVPQNVPHLAATLIDIGILDGTAYVLGIDGATAQLMPIDLQTGQVTAIFPIAAQDPVAMEFSPDHTAALVLDGVGNRLVVMPLATPALAAQHSISIPSPLDLAVGLIGGKRIALVTNARPAAVPTVHFVDLATETVSEVALPNPTGRPHARTPVAAVDSALGLGAVVSLFADGSAYIYKIALETQTLIGAPKALKPGFVPGEIVFFPPNRGVITDSAAGSNKALVFIVDPLTDAFSATEITVGEEPRGIAIDPKRNRLFVATRIDHAVRTIDLAGPTVTRTDQVGIHPTMLAFDEALQTLITINTFSHNATILTIPL